MKSRKNEKVWILLEEAFQNPFVKLNMKQIYNYAYNRILYDGFVIKKGHTSRWEFFCMSDYMQWKGLNNAA